jgi:hypothetical protein
MLTDSRTDSKLKQKNLWSGVLLMALSFGLLLWVDATLIVPLKELNLPNSGNDFGVFWSGAGTVRQGGNPYLTAPGSLYRQLVVKNGGNLQPLEPFISPYYLTLLFLPFSVLPLGLAATLWTGLIQLMLGVSLILIIKATGQPVSIRLLLAGVGLAMLWRYTFLVMMIGNLSLLLLCAITTSYYCSRTQRPFLAGLAASLLLVKPQIVFLSLPVLLLVPVAVFFSRETYRRWAGFASGSLILGLYSFSLMPGWVGDWLKGIGATGYADSGNLDGLMVSLRSLTGLLVADRSLVLPLMLLISLPLWLGLAVLWWRNKNNPPAFPYLLAVALALNSLTAPYIRDYDNALLLFGLLFCFFTLRRTEQATGLRPRVSWLCWPLALLPFPLHLLGGSQTYAVEILIPVLIILLTGYTWKVTLKPRPEPANLAAGCGVRPQ